MIRIHKEHLTVTEVRVKQNTILKFLRRFEASLWEFLFTSVTTLPANSGVSDKMERGGGGGGGRGRSGLQAEVATLHSPALRDAKIGVSTLCTSIGRVRAGMAVLSANR